MQKQKVVNHLACHDKTRKKARRQLFYVACACVLGKKKKAKQARTLPPRASVPACIICAWTDVTDVTGDVTLSLVGQIPLYGLLHQGVIHFTLQC